MRRFAGKAAAVLALVAGVLLGVSVPADAAPVTPTQSAPADSRTVTPSRSDWWV